MYNILLTSLFFVFLSVISATGKCQNVNEILKNAIPVSSINADDTDYKDLQFLKKKIGNATVVSLGEITHTDGATFSAKARLVKFLHKEMGFEVLAWEAGLLDTYKMNEAIAADSSIKSAKNFFMTGGWASSEYVNPVFEYAQKSRKTSKPLIMTGFDMGKPPKGYANANKVIQEAYDDCLKKFSEKEKSSLDSLLRATYGFLGNQFTQNITIGSRKIGKYILQQLIDSSRNEIAIRNYFLKSIMMDAELENVRFVSAESWNVMRDKFMFDRIRWLINFLYPGKKIIIWAASGHLIKNSLLIDRIEPKKNFGDSVTLLPQLGDYLSNYLGDKFYSIAFTTYQGFTGIEYPEGHRFKSSSFSNKVQVAEGSFEGEAHKYKMPYLFVDLKESVKSNSSKSFIAHPFGFSKDNAIWNKVVSAFFFIDRMFPDKVLKE